MKFFRELASDDLFQLLNRKRQLSCLYGGAKQYGIQDFIGSQPAAHVIRIHKNKIRNVFPEICGVLLRIAGPVSYTHLP